jgi:hypothetical protein
MTAHAHSASTPFGAVPLHSTTPRHPSVTRTRSARLMAMLAIALAAIVIVLTAAYMIKAAPLASTADAVPSHQPVPAGIWISQSGGAVK